MSVSNGDEIDQQAVAIGSSIAMTSMADEAADQPELDEHALVSMTDESDKKIPFVEKENGDDDELVENAAIDGAVEEGPVLSYVGQNDDPASAAVVDDKIDDHDDELDDLFSNLGEAVAVAAAVSNVPSIEKEECVDDNNADDDDVDDEEEMKDVETGVSNKKRSAPKKKKVLELYRTCFRL